MACYDTRRDVIRRHQLPQQVHLCVQSVTNEMWRRPGSRNEDGRGLTERPSAELTLSSTLGIIEFPLLMRSSYTVYRRERNGLPSNSRHRRSDLVTRIGDNRASLRLYDVILTSIHALV